MEHGCETKNEDAVGTISMDELMNSNYQNKYAVTITPSPHKRHAMTYKHGLPIMLQAYKNWSHDEQRTIILKTIMNFQKSYMSLGNDLQIESWATEITPSNAKCIHMHCTITTSKLSLFIFNIISKLGYSGKHNKEIDFILCKPMYYQAGWKIYEDKIDPLAKIDLMTIKLP